MRDLSELWRARVILEDGSIWRATSIGAEGEAAGEVVFNTAMSGYQEVLTDPSYSGQVVVMTCPLIGNYGVNEEDVESARPRVAGFLVREASPVTSNFRATGSLTDYLKRHGIVALEGIDTRALTRRIRVRGAMRIFMTTETLPDDELRRRLAGVPELIGRDLVQAVSCAQSAGWEPGFESTLRAALASPDEAGPRPLVVAYDFGAKHAIFRSLREVGCDVQVVPAKTPASDVLALEPDGVFLSNGPGDPRPLEAETQAVRGLLGRVPIFGICLGHQILAQALGAEIVKLKFGHHGSNHPVQDLTTGAVEITAQNHGFAVTPESLRELGVRVTHLNLNDGTVEGMEVVRAGRSGHDEVAAFSVQYHPEASPGPHDSLHLFSRFRALMARRGRGAAESATAS